MNTSAKPVALVTGASSGIGKNFAHRLINEGYLVYGAARRTDRMDGIKAAGGHVISLDVTDDTSILACVTQILREQQRIDVLINNAGYGQYGALEDVPIDEGRRQMETNLMGPARLTQLVLPHMRARTFGKIINISSIGGKCSSPLGGWYHASKFALEGYSDALRNEVRPFGIDVVVIEPGGVVSEWSAVAAGNAEQHSGQGPYAELVAKFRRLMTTVSNSPPEVISDLVVKALNAKHPAPRYHGGGLSGTILFLRRWLTDRQFDRLIMAALR